MKKLLLTFAFLSILIVIGCQENPVSEPLSNGSSSNIQKSGDGSYTHNFIILNDRLADPRQSSKSSFQITGVIEYEHSIINVDPISPSPQYYVSVNLIIDAQLKDLSAPNDLTWSISFETEEQIYVSEEGIYLLEITSPIQGREDGIVLVCRFLVTTDGVGLNRAWLALPSDAKNEIK